MTERLGGPHGGRLAAGGCWGRSWGGTWQGEAVLAPMEASSVGFSEGGKEYLQKSRQSAAGGLQGRLGLRYLLLSRRAL